MRWRQFICYRLKSEAGTNAELYRLAVVAEDSQTVGAVAFCANVGNHSHGISCSHNPGIGLRIIDFPSFPAILPMSPDVASASALAAGTGCGFDGANREPAATAEGRADAVFREGQEVVAGTVRRR